MRKAPTEATIKRLFALSGNRCAFPSCSQRLVDDDGNLLAQVCHIEAANPGGERYNPHQTDEQRAAFDNLILLCANHHIVTNNVERYPVAALRAMKQAHEAENEGSSYTPPDDIIERVLEQYSQTNVISGGIAAISQSGDVVFHYSGLNLDDAKSLWDMLFEANMPRMEERARSIARAEAAAVFAETAVRAKKTGLTESEVENLADPAVQMTFIEAAKSATYSRSAGTRERLAELLVARLKATTGSVKAAAVERAISIIAQLSADQIRLASLIFAVRHIKFKGMLVPEQLVAQLNAFVLPLMQVDQPRALDLRHMESVGLISIGIGSTDLNSIWRSEYPVLFKEPMSQEALDAVSPDVSRVLDRVCIKVGETRSFVASQEVLDQVLSSESEET